MSRSSKLSYKSAPAFLSLVLNFPYSISIVCFSLAYLPQTLIPCGNFTLNLTTWQISLSLHSIVNYAATQAW